jgi:retinol dehydrogenase 12
MSNKNIIVTGGTDGIGLAIVKKLIEKNHNIFIVGKNAEKGNRILNTLNNSKLEFFQADLSEKNETENLINKLKKVTTIDVLINNAGAVFEKREINQNNIEKTFALNHLSYFSLGIGILDQLENSINGRIINVASNAHKRYQLNLNDLENKINYNGWKAYCRSKLLNILFTYSFNKELKTKVTCNCFHPGFVNSNFGNNNSSILRFAINIVKNLFAISVEKSSITPIYLATSDDVKEISGKYFYKLQEKISSKQSYDDIIAKEVWEKSLEYIK